MENLSGVEGIARLGPEIKNQEITTLGDDAKAKDVPAGMVVLFRAIEGPQQGKGFPVHRVPATLGRDALCDISITDSRMSRQHAMLFFYPPDFFLKDMGSTNGTFVNDKRIKQVTINNGDQVKLGSTTLEFIVTAVEPGAGV